SKFSLVKEGEQAENRWDTQMEQKLYGLSKKGYKPINWSDFAAVSIVVLVHFPLFAESDLLYGTSLKYFVHLYSLFSQIYVFRCLSSSEGLSKREDNYSLQTLFLRLNLQQQMHGQSGRRPFPNDQPAIFFHSWFLKMNALITHASMHQGLITSAWM
ncbi:hypothetical protein ACJX0J_025725, partial [Zea mays]